MRDAKELYRLEQQGVDALAAAKAEAGPDAAGLVLLYHFEGFMDAGEAGGQVVTHLLEQGSPQVVARFDHDRLVDYRARRPAMTFDRERWTSYDPPEILLQLVEDAVGTPFLLITGPEPDTEWELFAAAVQELVNRFEVRLAVDFHGIPMGVPHTRPVGLTPHGTRLDLAAGYPKWFDQAQVPGSAQALLEYRLAESGHDVLGFAVHVPHYVARSPYPAAAVLILEAVQSASGLVLPGTELRDRVGEVYADIEEQLAQGDGELSSAIRGMESQYDAVAGAEDRESLLAESSDLPSADELGRRFEEFLAEHERGAE
ncbi:MULTISPECIES: proteasome assembly chaperone family protein [unclassified Kitasatospora]|uniref:proteasome assembly chaperone family protein n=1 Tax=unclassified Kitasatospora TaxID=2633591 RepID=UPI00070D3929|nr:MULTISPECIES: PAC2 family protein [unclassified Kitasatospora]KQV05558.1 proteasome protein [Kitasatospora sp. Root107]KRB62360.1 proteasome protein [Kitasatospora sp. Root187]